MNPMIQTSIDPFLTGFDAYNIQGTLIESEVNKFKEKLTDLAERHDDVATFFTEFESSGLQEEYGKLIMMAVQPQTPGGSEDSSSSASPASSSLDEKGSTTGSDSDSGCPISVKDFLEQYREPYNLIKAAGYRKRAEAAYEKIFDVASQTDNMLEAQIILEKERLFYKIVSEDILDITEPIIEAMDPIQKNLTFACEFLKEACLNSNGTEELYFNTFLSSIEVAKFVPIWTVKHVVIPSALAYNLLKYLVAGKETIGEWVSDEAVKEGAANMVIARFQLRKILNFMKDNLHMTFDDVCNNEASKIWLLHGINVDELGRVKTAWTPDNIEAFKEIIEEEILSDLSMEECLKRDPKHDIKLSAISTEGKNAYDVKAKATAHAVTADLTYYKYKSQLENGLANINSR